MEKRVVEVNHEPGMIMIALVGLILPLMVAVMAFSTAMAGKTGEYRVEYDEEMALLAAESGVDYAIYRGRIGALTDGVVITRDIGLGQAFRIEPTYLMTDGEDNDSDSLVDESDEDTFQVLVTGTYRSTTRRVAAYLGPVSLLPTIEAAMVSQDPAIDIQLSGTPLISGLDKNMDGSPGPGPDVPGFSVAPPGSVASLLSVLTPSEQGKIKGSGGTPSLGVASSMDLTTMVDQIKNMANIVLTSNKYTTYKFGDGPGGTANIIYRDGDVQFAGNSQGAGILVVTGDLEMKGNFRFDGVIIVLGKFENSAGTARVNGAIVMGPSSVLVQGKGTLDVQYSSDAINLANSMSGAYVSFNGWQEISRR